MSYLLPKRISELATIDSDLDTPDKRPKVRSIRKCDDNKQGTSGTDVNPICSSYGLPKRVADLDLYESDSEDDKNDR